MSNRRIKTTIGLRYDDAAKVATILKAIEDMLRAHPDIDQQQTLMVNLINFGASALAWLQNQLRYHQNHQKLIPLK